jgi:hypothetical protein
LTVSFLTSMRPDLIKGGVDVTDETETGTEVTA